MNFLARPSDAEKYAGIFYGTPYRIESKCVATQKRASRNDVAFADAFASTVKFSRRARELRFLVGQMDVDIRTFLGLISRGRVENLRPRKNTRAGAQKGIGHLPAAAWSDSFISAGLSEFQIL